jgi:cytochrome P450
MTAQGILFFLAAYDTSSVTLANIFYNISKNPSVQERLYEELSELENIDIKSLSQLKYLNACIMETLRLAPPLARFDREASQDYVLGNTGITIPKGTLVTFSPFTVHHNPEYFKDPFEYNPDRFMPDSKIQPHYKKAFFPFGDGPRMCPGIKFAMNKIQMCIAWAILKFKFSLASDVKVCCLI